MAKLVAEHEAELEKKGEEIREAREFAQEVNRKYKLTKRDYDEAKKSVALTGAHMKEMEKEQESWEKFLQAMDKQLSSKLLLRLLLNLVPSPSTYTFFLWFSQLGSLLQMRELLRLLRDFGKREPKKLRACLLNGVWRTGCTL